MRFDDAKIQDIILGRRAIGRSGFPGSNEVEIGVQLLSERQIDLARFEAQMYLEGQAKKLQLSLIDFVQVDPESLDREHQRQVIFQQLWEAYVDWQDVVNPRLELSAEEVTELAANLKDEPSAKVILAPFERDTLIALVRTMAALPKI